MWRRTASAFPQLSNQATAKRRVAGPTMWRAMAQKESFFRPRPATCSKFSDWQALCKLPLHRYVRRKHGQQSAVQSGTHRKSLRVYACIGVCKESMPLARRFLDIQRSYERGVLLQTPETNPLPSVPGLPNPPPLRPMCCLQRNDRYSVEYALVL